VIRAHQGGFQYTFQKYLKQNPDLGGKVSLKFTISPAGDVIAISIAGSNTGRSELDEEIRDKARRMKFDQIEKGNVTVTYAIVLNKQ
jgi:TonB family protein